MLATAVVCALALGLSTVTLSPAVATPTLTDQTGATVAQARTPTVAPKTGAKAKKVAYPKYGQTSVKVYELQQRLVKAGVLKRKSKTGHFNKATTRAVKKFQSAKKTKATGKVDQATWSQLVAETGKIALNVPSLDKRCRVDGSVICVDKTLRKLYYLKDQQLRQILDTRFGCSKKTPTREGRFQINRKSRDHVSQEYDVYMPYAMFFSGGQAVHWSKAFLRNGYNGCSHGCVNIRDKAGVAWLFDQVKVGDRLVVYRS